MKIKLMKKINSKKYIITKYNNWKFKSNELFIRISPKNAKLQLKYKKPILIPLVILKTYLKEISK